MKKYVYKLPLYVDRGRQSFGSVGAPLPGGRHDGFAFRLELVDKVVHLFPFGAQFKCFAWSTGSGEREREREKKEKVREKVSAALTSAWWWRR